ncbi:MAG: SLAP domain-containing protein [Staphylococcus epidermidis]|nr:SLAP domain-containing protein [Staphylococcus epidermidis]
MIDNAPEIKIGLLDPLANFVFLTANNPASVKIISSNPDVKRPQIRYVGTAITGNQIGMSDSSQGKNWVFNAKNSNLIFLTKIPVISDITETILPQISLTGLNETLMNDYQTPAAQIPVKGKASKTFADMNTLKDLQSYCSFLNGPLIDVSKIPIVGNAINNLLGIKTAPGLVLGTDLEDILIKTGAGRFNVSTLKQEVTKGSETVGDAKDILSTFDQDSASSRTIDELSEKKVVTGAQWLINKKMTSDGTVTDGGVITSASGKINYAALPKDTTSSDLGNGVIQVTYSDGTTDMVPVKIYAAKDTNGTGSNGSGSNGSTGTGSTGSNGSGSTGSTGTGSTGSNGSGSTGSTGTGSTGSNGSGSTGSGNTGSTGSNSSGNAQDNKGSNDSTASSTAGTGSNSSVTTQNSQGSSSTGRDVAVLRTVRHDAYVYNSKGKHSSNVYKAGTKVDTYGTKAIKGRLYYSLGNNKYIVASNINGTRRKLTHNAFVYNKKTKRISKKILKKGKYLKTYGGAVKLKGKKYYIVGGNKYIKKANFRK